MIDVRLKIQCDCCWCVCHTAEGELEEHKEDIIRVIAILQNDTDRDVRYLVSQLPSVTISTSDIMTTYVRCCYVIYLLLVCMFRL